MKIIGYARTTINDVDLTTQVEQLSDFGVKKFSMRHMKWNKTMLLLFIWSQ